MKKFMIIALIVLILQIAPVVKAESDCEYFVLPQLGVNAYTQCVQNPSAYEEYFIYHTVKFYSGGLLLSSQSVRDGDDAIPPADPVKSGYQFDGWNTSYNNITNDVNVYASFTQVGFTLTYKDYNGNTLKQELVAYGDDGNPPSVSRTGYSFTGWSDSYTNVDENRTLFAQYSIRTFTVRFLDLNDNVLKSTVVNYGGSTTPPTAPEEPGMTFLSWNQSYTGVTSSKDIYPVYEDNTYTVTFMGDDVLKVEHVPYGMGATAPDATKDGYSFVGWDRNFNTVTEDMTVFAQYQINSYTVSFQDDEGILLKTEEVEYLKDATPPLFEKEGFTFLGWDGNYSNIVGNTVLQPILEITTYTVKVIDYDGSVFLEEQVPYGGTCSEVTPSRIGYNFVGLSDDCSNIRENRTVTIIYEPLVFTFRFYNGDVLVKEELVYYGDCATEPVVSREGGSFIGWDGEICNVQTDVDVHALFDVEEYTATFLNYDGTVLGTRTVSYGDTANFPEPTREGYHFTGWSDSTIVKSNITLMAQYELNRYTVVFKYGDVILEEHQVRHGESIDPPFFSEEGVTLIKWDQELASIKQNMIVNAVTEAKEYKITFKDYNMNTLSEQFISYGQDALPPAPSRSGYTFIGWSSSYKNITSDNTLIAQYEGVKVEVTYQYEQDVIDVMSISYGSVAPQIEGYQFETRTVFADTVIQLMKTCENTYIINNEAIVLSCGEEPDVPIKEGYQFVGWAQTDSGLIANFEEKSFEVTFIVGEYMESTRVPEGSVPTVSDYLLDLEVEWDQPLQSITKDTVYTGYVEPENIPNVNIEYVDGVYLFEFSQDITDMELVYIIVDGELKTIDDYYIEKDKTSFFDRKCNWFKLHTSDSIDRVYFFSDIEYRYTVEEHYVDSNFVKRILDWVESIFS